MKEIKEHKPFSLILYIFEPKLNILVPQDHKALIEMISSNREEIYS